MSDILRTILDLIDTSEGTGDAKQQARRRLHEHINAAEAAAVPPRASSRPRRIWMAVGAAVLVLIVGVVVSVGPRPPEASAIDSLAHTVVSLPDTALRDVGFERRSVSRALSVVMADPADSTTRDIAYYELATTVRRQSTDGIVQITRTVTGVEYLTDTDPAVAADVEARLDVGAPQTVTQPVSERYLEEEALVSDDPDTLEQRIRNLVDQYGDPMIDDDVEVLGWILDLERTHPLRPTERAAALTVIGGLNGVENRQEDTDVVIEITYTTPDGRDKLTATFDPTGWLVAETLTALDGLPGITDGATLRFDATYTVPSPLP